MTSLFLNSMWAGIIVWAILYAGDYYLTIAGARLYRARVKDTIVFEGSYELTPFYQKDVNALKMISPRFIIVLVWVSLLLGVLWWLVAFDESTQSFYALLLGWIFLAEAAVFQRHLRNMVLFLSTFGVNGVRGRIEYPRSITLRLSAGEFFGFAGLYLFAFAPTWNWFLLGGAGGCLMIGTKHFLGSRSHKSQKVPAV